MIDLDGYFARIGYRGSREATYETLATLHALHPAAIPFENLDPLLGNPVALDLDSLQQKLVARRRGGYCFENNTLLKAVLERLGFGLTGLSARVVWNRFTLEPSVPADYEVANWFMSTHSDSPFRPNLVMERLRPRVRINAFNRRITRRFADGRIEELVVGDPSEFARVLEGDFAIDPPTDAATIFARLPA